MAVDKQKQKIALSVLEKNAQAKVVWVTFDNQPFLFEEPAIKHHEKYQVEEDPDVFFREVPQDENLSEEDYKKIIEDQDNRLKEFQVVETNAMLEFKKLNEELKSCKSEIQTKDSKIEEISAFNLEYEKKARELEKENESLKARVLELETVKPETLKDEGNAPKKGK